MTIAVGSSFLDRMAVDLIEARLVRPNDRWVIEHCDEAQAMFDDKAVKTAAVLIAALAPQAIDYLRQAPVLALALLDGSPGSLVQKKGIHFKETRLALARKWGPILRRGPKVKALLADLGLTPQHRKLRGLCLRRENWTVVKGLATVDPSTLAQIIPETPFDQMCWIDELATWSQQMKWKDRDPLHLLGWVARASSARLLRDGPHSKVPRLEVRNIADFAAAADARFNDRWTIEQAAAAMEEWHARLAAMSASEKFFERHGLKFDEPVDYGRLPIIDVIDDTEVVALRSGAELFSEGRKMRHCVATYADAVVRGRSRIFSIRKDEKRIATLELMAKGERWQMRQLCGPCNAHPVAEASAVARRFIARINGAAE